MALKNARRKRSVSAISLDSEKFLDENYDYEEIEEGLKDVEVLSDRPIYNIPLDRILGSKFQDENESKRGKNLHLLADSIHQYGLLNPIIVIEDNEKNGYFWIIAGGRRTEAYKINREKHGSKYASIPGMLLDNSISSDELKKQVSIIENVMREAPTLVYIMSNIEVVLNSMDELTKEEKSELIFSVLGKNTKRKGRVEFVYSKLEPLNLNNWSLTTCRRYMNVMEKGIEDLKNAFIERKITLAFADEIARRPGEILQKKLLKVYLKDGREALLKELDKVKQKKADDKRATSPKKKIKSMITVIDKHNDWFRLLKENGNALTDEEEKLLEEFKNKSQEIINLINDIQK